MKERIYHFDNIRAILIFLVVCGHVTQLYVNDNLVIKAIHIFIYMFHMPLFVFVSGYFSKNYDKCRDNAFKTLFVPYVVFDVAWYAFRSIVNHSFGFSLFTPGFALWYILALFIWRSLLKDLISIKLILPVSLGLGVIIGALGEAGLFLSISRVVYYLPFFLMGYYTNEIVLAKAKKIPVMISAAWFAVLLLMTVWLTSSHIIKYDFLYFNQSYKLLNIGLAQGAVMRVITYIVAIISIACFISVTPAHQMKISRIGENTINIYLFHGYFITILGLLIPNWDFTIINVLILIAFPMLITVLLSVKPFNRAYDSIMHAVYRILY